MTLTQAAIITKQVITLSIILLILGILSFIGYKVWYAYYLANLPPQEPIPDTKFGILPAIQFPQINVSSSNYTYTIDTTTGNLPKPGIDEGFDKIIRVYFIPKIYATFLSAEKSQSLAQKFNIKASPQVLSETNYLFKDGDKTLNVDLDGGNFNYTKEASISAREELEDDNRLVADFKNVLSSLGVLKEELNGGQTRVMLLKKEGGKWIPTTLRTESEAAQISLWPQSIDKKSLLTSDFNQSLVNAVIKKDASSLENFFSLNFTFWPIDLTTFATYPTKLPEKALEDLRSGQGVIIMEPPKPQVSITSIYLAYFLPDSYSPYLQPIYVFEGPQFVAYVPAISEQFQSLAR